MNFEMPLTFSGRRTAPVILQTEATECGLASLAMVAARHGHRSDVATLRSRFPISLKGATLAHLVDIAQRLDLAAPALKVEPSHLDKLALPAVLYWDFSHFVVLADVRGSKALIHDAARGRCVLSLDEATSPLDASCERQVNQPIRKLKVTRIIIAYRPETIACWCPARTRCKCAKLALRWRRRREPKEKSMECGLVRVLSLGRRAVRRREMQASHAGEHRERLRGGSAASSNLTRASARSLAIRCGGTAAALPRVGRAAARTDWTRSRRASVKLRIQKESSCPSFPSAQRL
jgi:predicted double-glycine peptidase